MEKTTYITTPIYYVNGAPHIGHAYTTLAADVLARFHRLSGKKVFFLTGTDEHGQKVEKSAEAAGLTPLAFADQISQQFRELADAMGFSYDVFMRTTEARHVAASQALWQRLEERGQIYLGSYKGWYSVRDEAFYAPDELTDGPEGKRAPTGAPVEWVEEPSYFFKLSAWQEPLLKLYRDHPEFIAPPARRNEVIRFVEGGLQDLSVSRTSFSWGIPVPGNPAHIMYVWLDALTNYITAAGFPKPMEAIWPADVHFVGKDILRFHAVYWPAFLMAAELPVPKRVVAHGWWTNEGEKISKSLGNVIDPLALVKQYGLDQVRYYLMREVPFGNDGNFTHAGMLMRMNGELANAIGNLAQRTLSMIVKHCGGAVPKPMVEEDVTEASGRYDALRLVEDALLNEKGAPDYTGALEVIVRLAYFANGYIDEKAPWTLKKTDPQRMEAVLFELAEIIRCIGLLLLPFVPTAAGRMLDQLGIAEQERDFSYLNVGYRLKPGAKLGELGPIFPKYVEEGAA